MTTDVNPFHDADTTSALLGQLAGAASVCWSSEGVFCWSSEGVFESETAAGLVDAAVERLNEIVWPE